MRRCMIDPNGTEGPGEASCRASCGLLQRAGFLYGVYGSTTRGIPRFAVAVLGFPGKIKIFISFHFTCSAPSCWRIGFRGARGSAARAIDSGLVLRARRARGALRFALVHALLLGAPSHLPWCTLLLLARQR